MKVNRKFWIRMGIILACLLTFIILAIVVISNDKNPTAADVLIRDFAYQHRGEKGGFIYHITKVFTQLGDIWVTFGVIFIVLILTKMDHRFFYIGFTMAAQWVSNIVLKLLIDRPRPIEELRWSEHSSTSFPSGHSETAGALFTCIIFLLFKSKLPKWAKIVGYVISPILILTVMATRIVLGVHYLTDTIAGASFGVAIAVACMYLYELMEDVIFPKVKAKIQEKKQAKQTATSE
ncbi:MAG: phosphatase PAP2 family protein [Acholeplasmatales bacterium]|nr:phosphatase PAP2 family protein [Acholeplasmatales bacterium]